MNRTCLHLRLHYRLLRNTNCHNQRRLLSDRGHKDTSQFSLNTRYRGRRGHKATAGGIPDDLKIFVEEKEAESSSSSYGNVHLNPASHFQTLKSAPPSDRSTEDQKSILVSVLGVPNAGKSSLINAVCGFPACAYSRRTHTTRISAHSDAILTEGDSQIVFSDTPGVVSAQEVKKFGLEEALRETPLKSAQKADLIVVVQDVSNRYVREAVDKKILKLLCLFSETPSILVLNKIDTIPRTKRFLDLIRKLTCNHLEGRRSSSRTLTSRKTPSLEDYLETKSNTEKKREKSLENIEFLTDVREKNFSFTERNLDRTLEGVLGWPNFRDVFVVSSTEGTGVQALKEYLLASAVERPWKYHPKLRTAEDPRDVFLRTIKAKLLEVLPHDVPYLLNPEIETWDTENGVLRLGVAVFSKQKRITRLLLSGKGDVLRQISVLAEQDLQNFFETEVCVHINVIIAHKTKSPTSPDSNTASHTLDVFS